MLRVSIPFVSSPVTSQVFALVRLLLMEGFRQPPQERRQRVAFVETGFVFEGNRGLYHS